MAHKARELQPNPLKAKRTYKPRSGGCTHSEAWSTVRSLSARHRFVSMSVAGEKVTIRAYD